MIISDYYRSLSKTTLENLAKFCKFLNFILIDSSCFKVWRWARCLQRYSSQRQLRSGLVLSVGRSVCLSVYRQFSRKTSLRILPKLGMKLQHDEGKKRTRPFVRKNSRSLIIHENVFWPYFGHFLEIGCPGTPDVVDSDRYHWAL